MKFTHRYKLNKDLPTYKKGWILSWSGNNQKFYPHKKSTFGYDKGKPDISLDMEHQGFTVEQIMDTEWFIPEGKLVDFIPAFPSKNKLEEFVYLSFETRLINDVDECRAMNELFDDKEFQDKLYEFVKDEYNKFHKLLQSE